MTQKITWDSFDRFEALIDSWMPCQGQGDTMASQMVTAINKLVYKWFNDGDVYDNTYGMEGWWNDLSSYANWLAKYIKGANDILAKIVNCNSDDDYTNLLYELAETYITYDKTAEYNKCKVGDIYNCDGPYRFVEEEDEEDWEDEEDELY